MGRNAHRKPHEFFWFEYWLCVADFWSFGIRGIVSHDRSESTISRCGRNNIPKEIRNQVNIHGPYSHEYYNINQIGNRIYLRNVTVIEKEFIIFGPYITDVQIDYISERQLLDTFLSIVNRYAVNLKKIHLHTRYNNPLGNVVGAFSNVEEFYFEGVTRNFNSSTLNFNEMFPEIRLLSLKFDKIDALPF